MSIRERHGRSASHNTSTTGVMTMEEPPPPPPQQQRAYYPTGIMRSNNKTIDDADVAAGLLQNPLLSSHPQHQQPQAPKSSDASSVVGFAAEPLSRSVSGRSSLMTAPSSLQSLASLNTRVEHHPSDLEFFEDLVSEPVLLLGVDISHLDRRSQFMVCAVGVFGFSLLYGYLQELISVELCNRQLGLFLAMMQFSGYTLLAYILRNFVYFQNVRQVAARQAVNASYQPPAAPVVPFLLYLGLSLLRAIDLGMTNLAMQYINYPAKTLMKSSRVVFTMLFGVVIARKVYKSVDYFIVMGMVAGLALFMHADANSSAVFDWAGVAMLTVSLLCDGAISNMSETIMNRYGVGQDEVSCEQLSCRRWQDLILIGEECGRMSVCLFVCLFGFSGEEILSVERVLLCRSIMSHPSLFSFLSQFIFRMYSIALVAISIVAAAKGDLREGLIFMSQPGSYGPEMLLPIEERTWSVPGKVAVMVLFSSMGFFGSSCSAAITKNFGALTMSITSTARKATTLFLSFFLFNNVCTIEHLFGVLVFIVSLLAKSLRRGDKRNNRHHQKRQKQKREQRLRAPMSELETRALHNGSSDERIEGSVVTLTGMEEGHHDRTLSPPSSLVSNLSDSAAIVSRAGRRQRKATLASASPRAQVV